MLKFNSQILKIGISFEKFGGSGFRVNQPALINNMKIPSMKDIVLIVGTAAIITGFGACASKKKQAYQPAQPMQEVVYQK